MLGVSEGKTTNKNLIKNSAINDKEIVEVGSFNPPSQIDKTEENTEEFIEVVDNKNEDNIEENEDNKNDIVLKEDLVNDEAEFEKPIVLEVEKNSVFNKEDAISGFEEANNSIKNLYDEIFGYSDKFKPNYKETVGDLLSYFGALSLRLNSDKEYTLAFGINPNSLPEKYFNNAYIPYAVKIGAWANKNKNKSNVFDILNGIIKTAFALAFSIDEDSKDNKVYNELYPIVDFIEQQGININSK